MHDELKASSSKELILWLLRLRRRYRVTGASMSPLLEPGDEVLVDPSAYRHTLPRPGDIVVALHPFESNLKIVKRVVTVREDGSCHLEGDNQMESSDSRTFGQLAVAQILGRVTSRFG